MTNKDAFSLLHKGIQKVIWDMQWIELKPFQVEAIHTILESQDNLLLCAQTASGKTEAAFLPIISIIAEQPNSSIQALYISPLKALINDQFIRLKELCSYLDIPVHGWHGDISNIDKRQLRENPRGILLITPESLESNFINYAMKIPYMYKYLNFIVIDEVHSFLDSVRGKHLQSLLYRLKFIIKRKPRIIGLSATICNPEEARKFIDLDNPDSVKIIDDKHDPKEIKFKIKSFLSTDRAETKKQIKNKELSSPKKNIRNNQEVLLGNNISKNKYIDELKSYFTLNKSNNLILKDYLDEIAEDILKNLTKKSNLVFVNAKSILELLTDRLHQLVKHKGLGIDPFWIHHGSLSKDIRKYTEDYLKKSKGESMCVLCSSTLELGIDIGAVRAIGQVGTPWSVSSMVQRLGRSGRKEGIPRIMQMYVIENISMDKCTLTDLLFPNLLRAIAMTELMLKKWLEPFDINRLHLSTLVHQILSCLRQTGGLNASDLYSILVFNGAFRNVKKDWFIQLLKEMGQKKIIEQMPTGEIILSPHGEKITNSHDFYITFQTHEEYTIQYQGKELGNLPAQNIPPEGYQIIFAGRRWKIEKILHDSSLVLVSKDLVGNPPLFLCSEEDIHTTIIQEMRAVLRNTEVPRYLDEFGINMLKASRFLANNSGILENGIIMNNNKISWYPWVGTKTLRTLMLFAKLFGIEVSIDEISLEYKLSSMSDFIEYLQKINNNTIDGELLAKEMKIKIFEKFDNYLPESLLNYGNSKERLNIEEAVILSHNILEKLN